LRAARRPKPVAPPAQSSPGDDGYMKQLEKELDKRR